MAKESSVDDMDEPDLLVDPDAFEDKLRVRIDMGENLLRQSISNPEELASIESETYVWDEFNTTMLRRSFTSPTICDSYGGYAGPLIMGGRDTLQHKIDDHRTHVRRKVDRLNALLVQVPLYGTPTQSPAIVSEVGTDIFIVHGRDDATKQTVARFVEKLCPEVPVVILHEQPNAGSKTIIEKLEAQVESAGFAVVLLTGDDEGRMKGDDGTLNSRARQNVVLELGMFMGRLGRPRVAVLYEPGVELPSDISGVLYTELDPAGAWKNALAREIQTAGLPIDLQQLIR